MRDVRLNMRGNRDLEERSDIDVKSQVGKPRCNDFSTAVMSVLAHFCHQDPGTSAVLVIEFLHRVESDTRENALEITQ